MRCLILTVLLGVMACTGCARHVPRLVGPVRTAHFSYVEAEPGIFVITADTQADAVSAMKELGCGMCVIDYDKEQDVVIVRKLKKQ